MSFLRSTLIIPFYLMFLVKICCCFDSKNYECLPYLTVSKALKYLSSSSWHVAQLLSYTEAGRGQVMQWKSWVGVLITLPGSWSWASYARKREGWAVVHMGCCAHSCAGAVVEVRLKWHEWDLLGPWLTWAHTSAEQVLFSAGYEFRKSHAVGYYLEYNLLQKCGGLISHTRCHLNVNKTAVCIPHIQCFLQQFSTGGWVLPLGSSVNASV